MRWIVIPACLPLLAPAAADEPPARRVRFATFNASLNRDAAGALVRDLSTPDNPQARNVAEIIQRVAPDVVLINEFDYDLESKGAELFQRNYLSIGQDGAPPIEYPHRFTAEVPVLATRDSAQGALTPGERQCFSCHEMRSRLEGMNADPGRDPHNGTCGMCHNPHTDVKPSDALKSCTDAQCHADWRDVAFHVGKAHRKVAERCRTCHEPHSARVDASDCTGCHTAVRKGGGTIKPPLSSAKASAAFRQSSKKSPTNLISTNSPPKCLVLSIFCCGVVTGMNTTPRRPKCRQTKAKPWAWLPADAQTKRSARLPAFSALRKKLKAPRIL